MHKNRRPILCFMTDLRSCAKKKALSLEGHVLKWG
nr:MAG TPA: hypothetical protein [Caudoviricetes sp.]